MEKKESVPTGICVLGFIFMVIILLMSSCDFKFKVGFKPETEPTLTVPRVPESQDKFIADRVNVFDEFIIVKDSFTVVLYHKGLEDVSVYQSQNGRWLLVKQFSSEHWEDHAQWLSRIMPGKIIFPQFKDYQL